MTSLFPCTPVPIAPRSYVHHVDRPRLEDGDLIARLEREFRFLVALSALPNTPFTGRFTVIRAD